MIVKKHPRLGNRPTARAGWCRLEGPGRDVSKKMKLVEDGNKHTENQFKQLEEYGGEFIISTLKTKPTKEVGEIMIDSKEIRVIQ